MPKTTTKPTSHKTFARHYRKLLLMAHNPPAYLSKSAQFRMAIGDKVVWLWLPFRDSGERIPVLAEVRAYSQTGRIQVEAEIWGKKKRYWTDAMLLREPGVFVKCPDCGEVHVHPLPKAS